MQATVGPFLQLHTLLQPKTAWRPVLTLRDGPARNLRRSPSAHARSRGDVPARRGSDGARVARGPAQRANAPAGHRAPDPPPSPGFPAAAPPLSSPSVTSAFTGKLLPTAR